MLQSRTPEVGVRISPSSEFFCTHKEKLFFALVPSELICPACCLRSFCSKLSVYVFFCLLLRCFDLKCTIFKSQKEKHKVTQSVLLACKRYRKSNRLKASRAKEWREFPPKNGTRILDKRTKNHVRTSDHLYFGLQYNQIRENRLLDHQTS